MYVHVYMYVMYVCVLMYVYVYMCNIYMQPKHVVMLMSCAALEVAQEHL